MVIGAVVSFALSLFFRTLCGYGAWYPYALCIYQFRRPFLTMAALSIVRIISCLLCGACVGALLAPGERWRCNDTSRSALLLALSMVFTAASYSIFLVFCAAFPAVFLMACAVLLLLLSILRCIHSFIPVVVILAVDLLVKCYILCAMINILLTNPIIR
jgi:hypothetical protein